MVDMMRPFCAYSEHQGIDYGHTYYAATEDDAKRIAELNGWIYDGEVCFEDTTDAECAMIERDLYDRTEN